MTADRGTRDADLRRELGLDEQAWTALTSLIGDGVIITDATLDEPGPRILFVNDAVLATTGYSRDEVIGRSPRIFQCETTDVGERARLRAALTAGEPVRAELVNRRRDGGELLVELDVTPIRGANGVPVGFVAIQRDVTERRLVDRWFRALVEQSAEMVSVIRADGVVTYASPSVERSLGWRPDELVDRPSFDLVHPDDRERLAANLSEKSRRAGTNPPVEFRFRHADGSYRWVEAVTTNLLDEPAVRALVVNSRDITSRKAIEEERRDAVATSARLHAELHEQAIRDGLTGVFNRDEAMRLMAAGEVDGVPVRTMIELDVDALAHVNETYGHEVGDAVLREVADRVRAIVPPGSVVGRLGPDEFVALLPCDLAGAASVVDHVTAAIRAPFEPHGRALDVTVCAGVAPVVLGDADRALRCLDLALSEAKRRGRDQCAIFEDRLEHAARTRVSLEHELRTAIARDQLRLHFQPCFEVATSRVRGMEALVRWEHPTRGLLAPGTFVPIAEASGQIVELGRWVARAACETRARLGRDLRGRMDGVTMWINASTQELEQPWYSANLLGCVKAAGLAPHEFGIELTESTLMRDVDAAIEHLRVLAAAGVRVAIDDFGTGYSSFAYLARLPIDVLKIDAGFTQAAAADRTTATVVAAITDLAHRLGATTCLEGVETPAQLDVARVVGADLVAGFLFARPEPEERLALSVVAA